MFMVNAAGLPCSQAQPWMYCAPVGPKTPSMVPITLAFKIPAPSNRLAGAKIFRSDFLFGTIALLKNMFVLRLM
jgi:hypothetical protein